MSKLFFKFKPTKLSYLASILLIFIICYTPTSYSQFGSEDEIISENPMSASAYLEKPNLRPGENTLLKIKLNLMKDHKAYVDMFKVEWISPQGVKTSPIKISPTFNFSDKFSKKEREGMKGKADIVSVVEMPAFIGKGEHTGEVLLTYQACTETYCLFPKKLNLKFNFSISGEGAQIVASQPKKEKIPLSFDEALNRGYLFTFFFVFFAGLLTAFTPCIFPMIPITLAVIGAKSQNQTRAKSFLLSLFYVLGIALTYSLLGVVAAKTGALFGAFLGDIRVVSGIALIFVLMALSMFGVFELRLPAFITQIQSKKVGPGMGGAFLTGIFAGLIASPCVGPVLVGILTYVANTQDTVLGFSLLFIFALGLGSLFLVLGTFSGLIQKLPRSGPWMEITKFIFGTVMLAAAFYYVEPVYPKVLTQALFGLTLISLSSVYGLFVSPNNTLKKLQKGAALFIFILGSTFIVKSLGVLPLGEVEQKKNIVKLNWQTYSDELLEQAIANKQPIILDFWADWCIACKELEAFTFTDPGVQELSKKFLLLKFDATFDSSEVQRLKKKFKVVGLPTLIFYDNQGQWRQDLTLTGFENAASFIKRMDRALNAPNFE